MKCTKNLLTLLLAALLAMMPLTDCVAIASRNMREPFSLSSELVPLRISSRMIKTSPFPSEGVVSGQATSDTNCFSLNSSALK